MLLFIPPPRYAVTVIGPAASVASFNDDGLVAGLRGHLAFIVQNRQTVWSADGYTLICGPNASGQVALVGPNGLAKWDNGNLETCTDIASMGGMARLGKIPDQLLGITDHGTVVGLAHRLDHVFALIQSPAPLQSMPLLQFLPLAMSPSGKIAGASGLGSPGSNPSAYLDTAPLDPLPADRKPLPRLHPSAVAPDGTVVGWRFDLNGHVAFRWKAGKLKLLPLPPKGGDDEPLFVNDKGQMLGILRRLFPIDVSDGRPWGSAESVGIWTDDSDLIDLDNPDILPDGWHLTTPFAIDNSGQILGNASRPDQPGAYLVVLRPNK